MVPVLLFTHANTYCPAGSVATVVCEAAFATTTPVPIPAAAITTAAPAVFTLGCMMLLLPLKAGGPRRFRGPPAGRDG